MNLFTIIVGLVNVALILYGVLLTRNHFKIIKVFTFIERFNSEEFRNHKINFELVLHELKKSEDKGAYLENLFNLDNADIIDKRTSVFKFINLLQEVSAAYRLKIINKKAILWTFGSIIPRYFFPAKEIIEILRTKNNDITTYESLEIVAKRLNKEFSYDFEKSTEVYNSYKEVKEEISLFNKGYGNNGS